MTKRAIIYGRVSYDDRDTDGRNLKSQLDMGRERAIERGYTVVDALPEDAKGASGAEIDLPQLNKIRRLAAAGEFDVLVVREIDRLSRNLAKQLIVEEELKRAGVEIEYVIGEYPDTPEGNLMKHVKASVAEYEREKIAERTGRARRDKAKSGKWVGHGLAFGFRKVGQLKESQLAIDEAEAEIVRRIFRWYGQDGLSLREIAHRLTSERVTTPGADYNKPNDYWAYFSVRRILANRSYIGEFWYAGILIPLPDMALVDMATFQRAQDRLLTNPKRSTKRTAGRYLLADHVYCLCKKHMTCFGEHSGYHYYACRGTSTVRERRHGCGERMLPTRILEPMIWQWLTKLMGNLDDLRAGLDAMATNREDEIAPTRARIADIDRLSKKADRTIAGLMAAFDPDDDDPAVVAALRAQVDAQKQLKAGLKIERAKLEAELERRALPPEQVADIMAFAAEVGQRMGQASWRGKDKLIDALNVRVEVLYKQGERQIRMSCDLPGVEETSPIILRANHSSSRNDAGLTHTITLSTVAPLPVGTRSLAENWLESAQLRVESG